MNSEEEERSTEFEKKKKTMQKIQKLSEVKIYLDKTMVTP